MPASAFGSPTAGMNCWIVEPALSLLKGTLSGFQPGSKIELWTAGALACAVGPASPGIPSSRSRIARSEPWRAVGDEESTHPHYFDYDGVEQGFSLRSKPRNRPIPIISIMTGWSRALALRSKPENTSASAAEVAPPQRA
jgi:hypothetical protein